MVTLRVKIRGNDLRAFQTDALKIIKARVIRAMDKIDQFMFREAERLADVVKSSQEFRDLKTPLLIGRFGFTPDEVAKLDTIFPLIGPSNNNQITKVKKRLGGRVPNIELNWVDFDRLKEHPTAQHPLTRFNRDSGQFERTGTIVSWIEWWEEGVTIRGHLFSRGNQLNSQFSRSGQGIMQKRGSSFFMLEPTRIFEKVGLQEANKVTRNLNAALRKLVKQET